MAMGMGGSGGVGPAGAAGQSKGARDALAGGLGGRRGGSGRNAGGMSPALLDSKYTGARKRKSRQYEASLENLAKAGTIVGSLVGGPAATAAKLGIDAVSGDLSVEGMLDPFSGRLPDTPSVGAGFAEGKDTDKSYVPGGPTRKKKGLKPATPLGSYGTILSNVGGSIRAGGL
jgi:hypothetical protein